MSSAIMRAIEHCGSEAKLALAAGVSQPAINKAKNAKRVSADLAVKIETATKGAVTRQAIRPDLWPVRPRRFKQAEAAE